LLIEKTRQWSRNMNKIQQQSTIIVLSVPVFTTALPSATLKFTKKEINMYACARFIVPFFLLPIPVMDVKKVMVDC
jgi:hypothetical protein